MKQMSKIIIAYTTLAVILFASARPVFAEGLNVSADKESCEIGDKITVSIEADGIGDGTVPPDIQVEFNSARLNFENCSVEYGGGGGGLVTFKDKSATVEFTTLSGGNCDITVTATAEDAGEPVSSTVTVAVNGEDTAAAAEAPASSTGVAEGTIDAGDGRVVQTVFADEFMPVLFHKETLEYNGQTAECAKFDMGDLSLLYTTDASGSDGRFMMVDAASGELNDFRMIQGIENRFIIVLPDCEGNIPAGYTKAVLDWNGQTLTAFMEESVAAGGASSEGGVNPADFFLVYAMSSEGNKGWYRYDKDEGTYQRYMFPEGVLEGEEESGEESEEDSSGGILDAYIPSNIQQILLLVCAPLALILLVTVIILAVRLHEYAGYDDYYEDDEYYEDEEEEDERHVQRTSRPGAVTAASLVGKSFVEEDTEDEDDEAEEDDEEDIYPDEQDVRYEEPDIPEDEEAEEDEDEEIDDVAIYSRPMTRKERRELAREEKWRAKEEKRAAKRRMQGYEEATPMDWSSFEKRKGKGEDDEAYRKVAPPKYMTEGYEKEMVEEALEAEEKAPLPPRKIAQQHDEEPKPQVVQEEEQRQKQRRLFEQQQRIEEQRRIEEEQREAERLKEQQQFIAARNDDDLDLDEDFQFEFLNL